MFSLFKILSWGIILCGLGLIFLNSNNIIYSAIGCACLLVKVLPKR